MKRKFTLALFLIMFLEILNFFSAFEVQAATLSLGKANNVYYTRRGGNKEYTSDFYPLYSIDGNVLYCIEPGIAITSYNYVGSLGLTNSPYDDDLNYLIQLIGYYGYEYPGHNTMRYRMATQALIWEKVGGQIVEFFTQRYGNGDSIDVSYEKNEIMKLVNNHKTKPSFADSNLTGYVNKEIIVEDKNQVLEFFEVTDSSGNLVRKDGNKLIITPTKIGTSTITLKKARYDEESTMIFSPASGKGQKVAKLRFSDEVSMELKITANGGKVTLEKVDKDTKLNIPKGAASLEGAVYGIYDLDDKLITSITTGKDGLVTSSLLPGIGKYKLKELKASLGYELDETVYEFEITADNLNPKVTVYEKVIERDIDLYKVLGEKGSQLLEAEGGITFDIYLKNTNTYYQSITTNEKGHAYISLPYGSYIFKQKNSTNNYEKVKDFEITIDENTKSLVEKTLYDVPIKAKLKVIKIDLETNEIIKISGIKFKLKDLNTNKYVCYNQEKCYFETDENGEFITDSILFGDFELEEVPEYIDGYLWNSQKVKIHIDKNTKYEDGNIITIKFANKPVKGQIKIKKQGEKLELGNPYKYIKIPLENVKFQLFAADDIYQNGKLKYKKYELITILTTDELGEALVSNLYLGKYYLEEVESSHDNLVNPSKYYFEINYQDQYTEIITKTLEFDNYLPKGSLEFYKVESKTGNPIPDTLIAIYKIIDKNNYELVYEGYTDLDGKIILNDLSLGSYFLKEIKSSKGYLLSDEIIYFDISKDKEIITLTMENTKEEVKVPKTGIDDNIVFKVASLPLMLTGLILTFYSFKKRNY